MRQIFALAFIAIFACSAIGALRLDTEYRRSPYVGAIAIDAATGKIILTDHAERKCYPASCTKLMTMYLALEAVHAREISLTDSLFTSPESLAEKPSISGLKAGDGFTLENALRTLMVKSANDVAVMVAMHVAGTVDAFVTRMNLKAKALGMKDTHFVTPNGYPPSKGSKRGFDASTAYDLALLAKALITNYPEILQYTSIAELKVRTLKGETLEYKNHNNLLANPKTRIVGVDGLKTGYHDAGGCSIVLTAKRQGKRVIAVVVGSQKAVERDENAGRFLTDALGAISW